MAIVRIRQLGDPILRRVSEPAANVRDAAEALINLRDTLHWFQWTNGFGRGISGVQIGDARRLIYLEFEGCAYCLINPELTAISADKFTLWDDCFSFPDLFVKVERAVGQGPLPGRDRRRARHKRERRFQRVIAARVGSSGWSAGYRSRT
jgi:peptide deformylase